MTGLRISVAVHAHRRLIGEAVASYLAGRPEFLVVGHTVEWPDLMALCGLGPPDAAIVDVGSRLADAVSCSAGSAACFPICASSSRTGSCPRQSWRPRTTPG